MTRSHAEFIGWRSELLAELFLREPDPEFLSRPMQDLGFDFLMDWPADDQPIWMKTRSGPLMSVPYPIEVNDSPQILVRHHSPEQFREENDQVLRAIKYRPDRACGFVYLNPNYLKASLDEFDRCVRDGPMVGVKLLVAKRCNASELDPIVERAATMKAGILQHTWLKVSGNEPGESTPHDVVELARRHPKVPIICGHTGGDWELGIRMIRASKNAFAELAGSNPTSGFVEMAVRELGAGRIIYGSDAFGRSYASQLGKVMGAEISEPARRLILGENLRNMLTPIMRTKGYQT